MTFKLNILMAKAAVEQFMALVNVTQRMWQEQKGFYWAVSDMQRKRQIKAVRKLREEALKLIIDLEKEIDILEEIYLITKNHLPDKAGDF